MSSLVGGPLFRAREEALSAEPEGILCVEPEKSLRVCLALEEALFYEPERRPSLLGPRGGRLASRRGGPLFRAREEVLVSSLRGGPLCPPSMRGGTLCRV